MEHTIDWVGDPGRDDPGPLNPCSRIDVMPNNGHVGGAQVLLLDRLDWRLGEDSPLGTFIEHLMSVRRHRGLDGETWLLDRLAHRGSEPGTLVPCGESLLSALRRQGVDGATNVEEHVVNAGPPRLQG